MLPLALLHQDVFANQSFHQETGRSAKAIASAKYGIANDRKNEPIPGYCAN